MRLVFLLSFIMHMHVKPTERQVLLFYKQSGTEIWEKQKSELNSRDAGLKERDILIKSFNIGSKKDVIPNKWNVDPSDSFTFILVGRDGGEKFRANRFVTADQLFALVDAMPMRKNEQRKSEKRKD